METYEETGSYTEEHIERASCKECGCSCYIDESRVPLCDTCREKYLKFPIPKKILIPMAIIFCAIAVFMLIRFPSSLEAGINYERALKSIEQKNYVYAEGYLEKAYAIFPDSPEIAGNLTVSYYKNNETDKVFQLLDEMYYKKMAFEDDLLFQKLDNISNEYSLVYNIPEEFESIYSQIFQMQEDDKLEELNKLYEKYPDNIFIKLSIANILFDKKQFDECEELVQQVMQSVPTFTL